MVSVWRRLSEASTTCLIWSGLLFNAFHLPPSLGLASKKPNLVAITTSWRKKCECFADDLFIRVWAVDFRGVIEGDAALGGCADELDGFRLFRRGAESEAQTHAAEAKG